MGQQSQMKQERRRQQVIHRTKLFGGLTTAEELNSREGFGGKCTIEGCPNLPVIQIKMFMLRSEFMERAPDLAAAIAATNPDGPYIPATPMTFGDMVMFSKANACKVHQTDAEKTAAKAPSWVLVEINRGPGADKPQVQSLGVEGAIKRI